MYISIPEPRPHLAPEPPAMVQTVARSDVMWNRPLFKAPPLVIKPPKVDARILAEDIRRFLRDGR